MTTESKQMNFLLWMTGLILTSYVGAALYMLITQQIVWKDFAAALVPLATGFAGYWLKGKL